MRTLCLAKQASHDKADTIGSHLHEVPRVVKFRETVNRMVVARGWGRGVERYYLMGPEFQFYKMKKMDHGNGHTTI